MKPFPESDWKIFRELREVALDRLCRRILAEAAEIMDGKGEAHDRFLKLHSHLDDRNDDIARTFDGLARSLAWLQLLAMRSQGLIADDEFARFSDATRASIDDALSIFNNHDDRERLDAAGKTRG